MPIDTKTLNISAPVKRHKIADYLEVDGALHLMGTGFTSINESFGAQEEGKIYVNDVQTTTWLNSYEPEFSYECDLISTEEAVKALREVGIRRLTGTDAMFRYVRVDLFQPKSEEDDNTQFYARRFIVSAIPDSEEGEGGENMTDSGTLKPVGDMEEGYFDLSTKTFTANDSTAV